jgi:hypothetical protein
MMPQSREANRSMIGANTANSAWRRLVLPDLSVSGQLISDEGTMGEIPNDIDRAAIEEHAQRTVEQTALRKVRKTLDEIEEAEAARRRTLRYVMIACAIFAMLGAWFFWGLMFSGKDLPKDPPMKIPGTLPQKQ